MVYSGDTNTKHLNNRFLLLHNSNDHPNQRHDYFFGHMISPIIQIKEFSD